MKLNVLWDIQNAFYRHSIAESISIKCIECTLLYRLSLFFFSVRVLIDLLHSNLKLTNILQKTTSPDSIHEHGLNLSVRITHNDKNKNKSVENIPNFPLGRRNRPQAPKEFWIMTNKFDDAPTYVPTSTYLPTHTISHGQFPSFIRQSDRIVDVAVVYKCHVALECLWHFDSSVEIKLPTKQRRALNFATWHESTTQQETIKVRRERGRNGTEIKIKSYSAIKSSNNEYFVVDNTMAVELTLLSEDKIADIIHHITV